MGRKRSSNDISMVSRCHPLFFQSTSFYSSNEYTSFMDNTVYYLEFSFKELVPRKEIRDEGGRDEEFSVIKRTPRRDE